MYILYCIFFVYLFYFLIYIYIFLITASLSGGGCPGCPGASTFGTASPKTELRPHGRQTHDSSHEPPRQAEGTSEQKTKLGEKGLMAGRSLSPNTPNPEAPTYVEQEETYTG